MQHLNLRCQERMFVVCVMRWSAADAAAVCDLQQDEVDKAVKDTADAIAARTDDVDDQQHLPRDDNDNDE